jgi:glucosamine--fructose-6-phosphate aminotransferase (isomerizing)
VSYAACRRSSNGRSRSRSRARRRSPADLLHGPIAAIQPGWPVIVVAPTGPARPSVEEVVVPLVERGARVIAVSDVAAVLRRAHTRLPLVPRVPEWLSPLTAVIPGQVTAMQLAQLRGLDIDSPSGLRKITLTR